MCTCSFLITAVETASATNLSTWVCRHWLQPSAGAVGQLLKCVPMCPSWLSLVTHHRQLGTWTWWALILPARCWSRSASSQELLPTSYIPPATLANHPAGSHLFVLTKSLAILWLRDGSQRGTPDCQHAHQGFVSQPSVRFLQPYLSSQLPACPQNNACCCRSGITWVSES